MFTVTVQLLISFPFHVLTILEKLCVFFSLSGKCGNTFMASEQMNNCELLFFFYHNLVKFIYFHKVSIFHKGDFFF